MIKGFPGSARGGLVTPPSPRSMSADSNRLKQRKKVGSSRVRGRSASRGAEPEVIDCGAKSEYSTTSTHPSLRQPRHLSLMIPAMPISTVSGKPHC